MNTTRNSTQNIGHIFHTHEKGMIFSLDATIAFTIMLFGIILFTSTFANNAQNAIENIESIELEEKSIIIADSLVKNYDENNALLGSCIVDLDKKRVKSNEISIENIKKAKPLNLNSIFVEKIKIQTNTISEIVFLEKKETSECYNIKRFGLIEGEKGLIEVTTCRE